MKKTLIACLVLFAGRNLVAQSYSPIAVTGYNTDAVAENTTALANTSNSIDGSNFVLYSAFYGSLFSPAGTGLPNSGTIVNGLDSYQMAPYTQNNLLYLPTSGQVDSLVLNNPASYAALSILDFGTEGAATMSLTVRFTDNSTQAQSNVTVSDWFNGASPVISNLDRVSRSGSTPAYVSGNPRMYASNFNISCANRSKLVRAIIFKNNGSAGRLCVAGISGAALPIYTASVTPIPCAGGTSSISIVNTGGMGPFTYVWGTSPVQTAATATGLAVGSYTYSVTDGGGCVFTSTATMPPTTGTMSPPVVLPFTNPVCSGQSMMMVATGAASYTWTGGITNAVAFTPTASGSPQVNTYTVSGSNACNSSTNSSVVSLTINPNPTIIAVSSSPSVCTGSSISLTGSGATSSYTWSAGATNGGTFVPAATNTYVVWGSNSLGCTSSATTVVTVVVTPTIPPNASSSFICIGGSATLSALGASAYSWQPVNANTSSIVVSPSSSTTYTITKANGACSDTKTISIIVYSLPTVTAVSSSPTICAGYITTLNATSAGAVSYSWMPGPISGSQVVVNPFLNTVYTVSAFNGTCSGVATVTLVTVPLPTVTSNASSTYVCSGESVTLTATGGLTYSWSPNAGTGATVVVTPTAPIQYSVAGSNAAGCLGGSPISIIVNSAPSVTVSASAPAICNGDAVILSAGGANTYTWDVPANTSSVSVSPSITTVYSVTGTGSNSCTATKTIQVDVITPTVSITGPNAICSGQSATLIANGASSYTWSAFNNASVNIVTPTVTTAYTLSTLTNSLNISCGFAASVQVVVNPLPVISAVATRTSVCKDEAFTLTASGASTYTWSNNANTPSVSLTASVITTMIYTVAGTSSLGCVNSASVVVKIGGCVSLGEIENDDVMSVYPNPSNGEFIIEVAKADVKLVIFNNLGQNVASYEFTDAAKHKINLSGLPVGVYYLSVNGRFQKASKIVIER